MPALRDTIRKDSPAGFAPTQAPLALPPQEMPGQTNSFKVNPWIRSPLPPINAGPDTLRQFNDGDANVPRRRVLPLPVGTGQGGAAAVTNTTVVQAASSAATTGLTTKTVSYTSPLLTSNSTITQSLSLTAKSFQLVSVTANAACEIRMYGSALAMAVDATRVMDAPPPAEWQNGIITDVVLDTAPYTWNWENRVGCNSDSPQTTNLYIAVTNLNSIPQNIQLSIVLLPLESA